MKKSVLIWVCLMGFTTIFWACQQDNESIAKNIILAQEELETKSTSPTLADQLVLDDDFKASVALITSLMHQIEAQDQLQIDSVVLAYEANPNSTTWDALVIALGFVSTTAFDNWFSDLETDVNAFYSGNPSMNDMSEAEAVGHMADAVTELGINGGSPYDPPASPVDCTEPQYSQCKDFASAMMFARTEEGSFSAREIYFIWELEMRACTSEFCGN